MPDKPTLEELKTDPTLRTAYDQLCNSYRAIDDFRAKLMGFLPLASGGGIFLILQYEDNVSLLKVGAFGFIITLGLIFYEIYGIKKCHCLIERGRQIEEDWKIVGQFRNRPREFLKYINEVFASGVIYSAVLAAWTYLGLYSVREVITTPIYVFIISFAFFFCYNIYLRKSNNICPESRHKTISLN